MPCFSLDFICTIPKKTFVKNVDISGKYCWRKRQVQILCGKQMMLMKSILKLFPVVFKSFILYYRFVIDEH